MKIAGIVHEERNLEQIYHYIRLHNPKKVLLEMDPKVDVGGFFGKLEKKINEGYRYDYDIVHSKPAVEIVKGDIYQHIAYPYSTAIASNPELLKKHFEGLSRKEIIRLRNNLLFATINEAYSIKAFKLRDEGMYESTINTQPDLAVVGAMHAINLKKKLPNYELELLFNKSNTQEAFITMPSIIAYARLRKIRPKIVLYK